MFVLQEQPIDLIQARSRGANPLHGALVSFEGIVRSDACGAPDRGVVNALLYVADQGQCVHEGKVILRETRAMFSISEAVCIQRVGKVNAGETAVWIGVWAAHRGEAFNACRHIIEEIKKRLHIWKKEFSTDGTSKWVQPTQATGV